MAAVNGNAAVQGPCHTPELASSVEDGAPSSKENQHILGNGSLEPTRVPMELIAQHKAMTLDLAARASRLHESLVQMEKAFQTSFSEVEQSGGKIRRPEVQPRPRGPSRKVTLVTAPDDVLLADVEEREDADALSDGKKEFGDLSMSVKSLSHRYLQDGQHRTVTATSTGDVATLVHQMTQEQDLARRNNPDIDTLKYSWFGIGEEPQRTSSLAQILLSPFFEAVMAVVIVINAIYIGVSLQVAVSEPDENLPPAMQGIQLLFLFIFTVELIMKLLVHRWYFFVNHDWAWNILDLVLVAIGTVAMLTQNVDRDGNGHGFNVTFVRIIRLCRVWKMFRLFQVLMFFRELRTILRCLYGSITSLLWSATMIMLLYYVFALAFLNGAADFLRDNPSDHDRAQVEQWYGSLWRTMQALYMATSGGADWATVGEPLKKMGYFYYGMLHFFIAFTFLAVVNIVTGIFVDNAMQASRGDIQEIVLSNLEEMRTFEKNARALFAVMDRDHDGLLIQDEFLEVAQDGAHSLFFAALGLEYSDYEELHALFCHHLKTHNIDEERFVDVCRRFRNNAKYSDVVWLRRALSITLHKLDDLEGKLEECLSGLPKWVVL